MTVPEINIKKTCFTCNKKLSFIEKNTCLCSKCNNMFCTLHRLAEAHKCIHNFKNDIDREQYINNNKCVADKITKL